MRGESLEPEDREEGQEPQKRTGMGVALQEEAAKLGGVIPSAQNIF